MGDGTHPFLISGVRDGPPRRDPSFLVIGERRGPLFAVHDPVVGQHLRICDPDNRKWRPGIERRHLGSSIFWLGWRRIAGGRNAANSWLLPLASCCRGEECGGRGSRHPSINLLDLGELKLSSCRFVCGTRTERSRVKSRFHVERNTTGSVLNACNVDGLAPAQAY